MEVSNAFGIADAVAATLVQIGTKGPSPAFAFPWLFEAGEGVESSRGRSGRAPELGKARESACSHDQRPPFSNINDHVPSGYFAEL